MLKKISPRRNLKVFFNFYSLSGKNPSLPKLPTIPGDEGVGEVVEIGSKVSHLRRGHRVIITKRMLGTWRYYGIFHERSVFRVSRKLPLPEAAMLTIAPCTAYRLLRDFKKMNPGDTVLQNAANSPTGQCIIMLCKIWNLKSVNIVANHTGYESVKQYLTELGGTIVCTVEEAEEMTGFSTAITRPRLAFNCLGGRYEDVMLKMLDRRGTIVYYGCAYDLPLAKRKKARRDAKFHKFHFGEWSATADSVERSKMLHKLTQYIVLGKVISPIYQPLELRDYMRALKNTSQCDAFLTSNYIFDLTCP